MKALVLAGGMPQLYLIQELKKRGISSILVDRNDKAPAVSYADAFHPISAADVEAVKELAVREKVDFILSVCADQILLVAAQVSEELGLPCYIDFDTAKKVSSKEQMKQIFEANGIPTARYLIQSSFDPSEIENLSFPLVTKPVDAYSSRGVRRVENMQELESAFNEAVNISRTGSAVIEEYVEGDELSVDLYVEEGTAKICCIRALDKVPEGNGFIICRGRYPVDLTEEINKEIECVGQAIADAFSLRNTPMLIQLITDGSQVKVVEFCARTGGGIKYRLLPRVSGFDPVKAVVDLTLGDKPHYDGFQLEQYIIDEFLYCNPGIFDHIEGFEELLDEGTISHYLQFKPSGHSFDEIRSSGDRVAYFSVEASTLQELKKKHQRAVSRIKVIDAEGSDMLRRDILNRIEFTS